MKKLVCLILLLICTNVHAGQWRNGSGENTILGSSSVSDIDSNSLNKIVEPLDRLLAGYREGMNLTYTDGSTITVGAGEVMLSNAAGSIRLMVRNASTTAVTFANIDAGAEQASTTYYIYAGVASASDETATFKISANSTTPTGFTYYRRLGTFYNNSSSAITSVQNDNFRGIRAKESKTVGSTYSASTDGRVVAYATCGDNTAYALEGKTDTSSTPTTTVAMDSCTCCSVKTKYATVSFDVKAGDYYTVSTSDILTGSTGGVSTAMYFIPDNQ